MMNEYDKCIVYDIYKIHLF